MKKNRQNAILELIDNYDIGTQEELCERLREQGFKVTQATVSRDIREMKLLKLVLSDGSQKYGNPNKGRNGGKRTEKYDIIMKEAVVSVDSAKNLLVIKAHAGMGAAVGAMIDAMKIGELVGSIAGDDTVLCVMRSDEDACALEKKIHKMILEY